MTKKIFLICGAAVVLLSATAFMLSRPVCGNTPQDIARTLEAQKEIDGALEVAAVQDVGQQRLAAFFEDRGTEQARAGIVSFSADKNGNYLLDGWTHAQLGRDKIAVLHDPWAVDMQYAVVISDHPALAAVERRVNGGSWERYPVLECPSMTLLSVPDAAFAAEYRFLDAAGNEID